MSASAGQRMKQCNVLDFFYDDENGSALTVLVNGVRFHLYVDYDRLKSSCEEDDKHVEEYSRLIRLLNEDEKEASKESHKSGEQSAQPDSDYEDAKPAKPEPKQKETESGVYCLCRGPDRGFMIGCDSCDEWYHGDCVGIEKNESELIKDYICPQCKDDSRGREKAPSHDSGIVLDQDNPKEDHGEKLRDWLLSYLKDEIEQDAPSKREQDDSSRDETVHDWYHSPTKYYSLESKDGRCITAVEVEETPELLQKMQDMIPSVHLPKYILNLNLPWVNAQDITILSSSTTPEPIHPATVLHNSNTYFLKVVDATQPGPTKRELKLLHRLERLNLSSLRFPRLQGLVRLNPNTSTSILGFLLTNIPNATPLTHLLDSDIPQRKRDRWAKESQQMVDVLHDNDIIWGDAKADNFMVDEDDKLWIIDFGGSYTEGWVDEKLNETEEGDDQGTEKIVNALRDPDQYTFDVEEGEAAGGEKRGRDEVDGDAAEDEVVEKRVKA